MEEITNRKGVPAVAVVGITILAAIIFGAGAYMYANNQATQEKDALNAQIVTLQNEVTNAKKSTTTDTEIADWKTYTNTRYGFSFEYPDTVAVSAGVESTEDPSSQTTAHGITVFPKNSPADDSIFYIAGSDMGFTTETIMDHFDTIKAENISVTPTTIAELSAYKVIVSEDSYKDYTFYFIQSPTGTVLELHIISSSKDAQKILSSLKFTDKAASIPANWKTYKNSEYGFEISYPTETIDPKDALEIREGQPADIDSYIVGFKQGQDNLVSIEKFNDRKEFSDIIAVNKVYKIDNYYLVIEGVPNDTVANKMISTFKLTK